MDPLGSGTTTPACRGEAKTNGLSHGYVRLHADQSGFTGDGDRMKPIVRSEFGERRLHVTPYCVVGQVGGGGDGP